MQNISKYLKLGLIEKNSNFLIKKSLAKIILEVTKINLDTESIKIIETTLKIKTKPILKHKLVLFKKELLEKINKNLKLNLTDIV